MSRQIELEKLKNMQIYEEVTINWFEEGGGLVYLDSLKRYSLYEVAQYGGSMPCFIGSYSLFELDQLLDLVYTWT